SMKKIIFVFLLMACFALPTAQDLFGWQEQEQNQSQSQDQEQDQAENETQDQNQTPTQAEAPTKEPTEEQAKKQPQTIRRVKRAARPVFEDDASGLFFKNVYAEGTVGERPDIGSLTKSATALASTAGNGGDSDSPTDVWSQIVDASVIEDEVKSLQQQLNQLVTSPVVFQTKYDEVNQRFEMLSMLFAIIRQYDGDIRWTEQAPVAQFLFQKAAVASRNGAAKGFQYCKARKEDLQELVRGGSIVSNEPVADTVDWESAVNRTPIMEQLEVSNDELKRMTSSESEFKSNTEQIFHQSNLLAAMAKVIIQEGMPDAEEEGYVEFGRQMETASLQLKSAVKLNDFGSASSAANAVSQSCADCHDEWR
ncbi:hypothetical protein OAG71_00385, partial [bacterium]|nr:hypothetical protein [bacterium]